MDPQQAKTATTFDGYNQTYSKAVDASVSFTGLSTDFFTRVKAAYIDDIVTSHFGAEAPVKALDVGCGVGNYHPLLRSRFQSISGVDVSGACVETARLHNDWVDYKTYDGGTLPYADDTFDVAFTICVLHHVPPTQWEKFASEMHRVVRPGGLALVFEHNPRNPLTMRAVNSCPFDEDAVLLKNEKTEALLRGAGFSSTRSRYILSIPPANGMLRKIDRMFSRLPFGGQYYVVATA